MLPRALQIFKRGAAGEISKVNRLLFSKKNKATTAPSVTVRKGLMAPQAKM
jgi:hypothetical protein